MTTIWSRVSRLRGAKSRELELSTESGATESPASTAKATLRRRHPKRAGRHGSADRRSLVRLQTEHLWIIVELATRNRRSGVTRATSWPMVDSQKSKHGSSTIIQ